MKVNILKNTRLRHKFCGRMNKTFGCREVYLCSAACPLWLAFHVEYLMEEKNYTFGEAFRQTVTRAMDEGEGRKVIKDAILKGQKDYPPKGWRRKE